MRKRSDRALPTQEKGKPIKASTINGAIEEINRNRNTDNAISQPIPNGKQAIGRFQVVSDQGDYLTCYSYAGDAVTTSVVNVAKPYLLRVTPFNGFSRNGVSFTYSSNSERTATAGSAESQIVVASYIAGDQIMAVTNILGSSGVTASNGDKVIWCDLNVDGRFWSQVYEAP